MSDLKYFKLDSKVKSRQKKRGNLPTLCSAMHSSGNLVNKSKSYYKDNGLNHGSALPKGHEEIGGEATFGTQNDQLNLPPVSAMVEAVTKSVETALQTLLESGGHFSIGAIPWSPRQTPWQRRQENHQLQLEKAMEPNHHCDFILAEVCHLFKEKLGIVQDINFIMHVSANAGDVCAYEYEDGPSPDTDNVTFDLMFSSFMNFKHAVPKKPGPSEKMMTILKRNAQPKLTAKGLIEMPAKQEAWLVEENLILGKESRQATHHRNVGIKYHRRKTVLDCIITTKSEVPDDDLCSWQWLQCLINSLGEHGMSSEESSVENGIENVLRVKKMEWQKNVNKELEIIDLQWILNKDIFCSQGTKPLPRKGSLEGAIPMDEDYCNLILQPTCGAFMNVGHGLYNLWDEKCVVMIRVTVRR
ncbi:hypothetical protein F5141DRAFT_1068943 [Pisolithus sp. B1]|nr:hypothetical protein F5141DRAFT_1068943 [Pisolithus sp. B1]